MWKKENSRILIIEDANSSDLTLRSILKIGQYSVLSAFSDISITEIADKEADAIIIKLPLQTRNGLEILKTLKQNYQTKNIPVMMVSKINTQTYWDAAYTLGADAYLVTPNHYPYILKRLHKICNTNFNNSFVTKTLAI